MHAELRRVHVDAYYDSGVLSCGEADERQVAGVEGPHGGDETDGAVVEQLFAAPLAERCDVAEDFYGCVWDYGVCRSSWSYKRSCKCARKDYGRMIHGSSSRSSEQSSRAWSKHERHDSSLPLNLGVCVSEGCQLIVNVAEAIALAIEENSHAVLLSSA